MLGWDNVSTYLAKQKALVMYKTMHNLTPAYLRDLFTTRDINYDLRDSEDKLLLPKPSTVGHSCGIIYHMTSDHRAP